MKKNFAYKLYEEQLRVEDEMKKPFQKRPLVEPKINPDIREKYLKSNPYYSTNTELSDIDKAQKIRLLKSVGISLPPGVDPDGLIADDYIKKQIENLSNEIGTPLRTISDLASVYDSPSERQERLLEGLVTSLGGSVLNDPLLQNLRKTQQEKEKEGAEFLWNEAISEAAEEEKEFSPSAQRFMETIELSQPLLSDEEIKNMSKRELNNYAKNELKMAGRTYGSTYFSKLTEKNLRKEVLQRVKSLRNLSK